MTTLSIKRKFWDLIRPLHSPFTKAVRQRLARNYSNHSEMDLPPAYEAIQLEVERRLHCYLHVDAAEIRQIVIVGAHDGEEITRLRQAYPSARFLCFEPSPIWHAALKRNFHRTDYVDSRALALSESPGMATFHELSARGNGSLLAPDVEKWSKFNRVAGKEMASFQVKMSTLDEETRKLRSIDLLWIDVQGAEHRVLQGGMKMLHRVAAVFLEVALVDSPYQGALLFPELDSLLHDFGFVCVGLGTDSWNYGGNALWVRNVLHLTGRDSKQSGQGSS